MTYLFLDTSFSTLILSLIKSNKIIETTILENSREHSVYAVHLLEQLLSKNKVEPNEVDKIFVVNGPGSFTGIRIGLTIAKTYAYALKKDITLISSLKMAILEYNEYDNYVSVIEDKREMSFAGIYNKNYDTIFEGLISNEELTKKLNNLGNYKLLKLNDNYAKKDVNIISIINYYKNVDTVNPHNANPNYLKEVV